MTQQHYEGIRYFLDQVDMLFRRPGLTQDERLTEVFNIICDARLDGVSEGSDRAYNHALKIYKEQLK